MKLHKEGTGTIVFMFVLISIIIGALHFFITPFSIIHAIIYLGLIIVFGLTVYFFRYPDLQISPKDSLVLCPADGKVVVIEKTFEDEFLKTECLQISIFMSPLDTHMNRYPISGVVDYFKYHPGKFLVAWHPKSSTLNERTTVVLSNAKITILLRQIAGAMARRIVCYADKDTKVKQGEQLGFIKFGSRVDLFLPLNTKINVKLNQVVKAGKTIIAEY